MWLNGVGQNRETDEEHDEDCVEEAFPGWNLTGMAREAGMLSGWDTVVAILDMDYNWNYLCPGKAVNFLKTIFQFLYYW